MTSPKYLLVLKEIKSVFLSNFGDLKKKKKVFAAIRRGFSAKIRNSKGWPKTGDLKKKVFTEF